ncbi:hypothetical protein EDC01DRAFT_746867 [Geopyxis carbonaria]|nr:hypothetical protein EDC01DRAFT_746867 [Geopyxis carbonaria]
MPFTGKNWAELPPGSRPTDAKSASVYRACILQHYQTHPKSSPTILSQPLRTWITTVLPSRLAGAPYDAFKLLPDADKIDAIITNHIYILSESIWVVMLENVKHRLAGDKAGGQLVERLGWVFAAIPEIVARVLQRGDGEEQGREDEGQAAWVPRVMREMGMEKAVGGAFDPQKRKEEEEAARAKDAEEKEAIEAEKKRRPEKKRRLKFRPWGWHKRKGAVDEDDDVEVVEGMKGIQE